MYPTYSFLLETYAFPQLDDLFPLSRDNKSFLFINQSQQTLNSINDPFMLIFGNNRDRSSIYEPIVNRI